jgi:hypothetical protein
MTAVTADSRTEGPDGDARGPDARAEGPDGGTAGAVEYDCSPWAGETRRILRSVLDERAVPHAWEGTVVVVPAEFEEVMDRIVDEVAATARPSLGRSRARVAYEVAAWSAASQNRLVDLLVEHTVPHEWDAEGDLVVHEEDAELTEELIAELGEPDGAGEMDGVELHDHLGRLFVAADRLAHDPYDAGGRRQLAGAHGAIEDVAVPFGIEAATWLELHRVAASLREALEPSSSGGDRGVGPDHEGDPAEGELGEGDPAGGDPDEGGRDERGRDEGDLDDDDRVEGGDGPGGPDEGPEPPEVLAARLRDLLRRLV